jgi:CheY-like chemotaxis protein
VKYRRGSDADKDDRVTRRKILLIEDEDDIREIVSLSLESLAGWETISANGGRAGVEQAVLHQPDAILLDVMMPEMDGPTTLRHLRSTPTTKGIPVIVITAKVQTAEKRKLAEFDVQGFIGKPFDPLRLAEEISEALGWD